MASLDVESLFINIPLEKTISVCCDSLFSNDAKLNNINRIDFEKLLKVVTGFVPTISCRRNYRLASDISEKIIARNFQVSK